MFGQLMEKVGAVNPHRYLKSAFWLTSTKVASMAVSLVVTFYIARTLGPQNFGELSYAQSVLAILTVLSASVGALYRDIVKHPERESKLLGTAWSIYMATSLLSILLALAYVFILPHDRLTILVLSILCLTQFFSPFSIIQNVFYAKTETKWLSASNLSLHILVSVAKIFAMTTGQGVVVLASIMVTEQALMAVIFVFLYTVVHKGSILKWGFDGTYAKRLVIDSLPIIFVAASGLISARIDQIFIKHYLDITSVGLYSVAVQLSEIWQFLPGIILTAIFPAIVNARIHDGLYRQRLGFLVIGLSTYGLIISAVLTVFASSIIGLIYGPAFTGSVITLQIYIWSLPGMILGLLATQFLLAENMRKIQIICALIPLLLNIALNLMLIPSMGMVGAAWATVISYTLYPLIPLSYRTVRDRLREPAVTPKAS